MGFHSVINFVGPSGQTRVIPVVTLDCNDVTSHTLGAIDVGMLMVWAFLTCSEHLVAMLAEFLEYSAVMQDGRFARGWNTVLMLQNCPLASLHILVLLVQHLYSHSFVPCNCKVFSVNFITCRKISMRDVRGKNSVDWYLLCLILNRNIYK